MSISFQFHQRKSQASKQHKTLSNLPGSIENKNDLVKNFNSHVSKLLNAHKRKMNSTSLESKFLSSFTLQQSISNISFPKATRLDLTNSLINKNATAITLPSTLSPNNHSFGYGEKYYLPKSVGIKAREYPSPSTYFNHENDSKENNKKGQSFGLSYAHYTKNFIPGYRIQNMELNKKMPGPGQYDVDRELGDLNIKNKKRVKISIKGKQMTFIDEEIRNDQSPKKFYFPNTNCTKNNRFQGVSFGMGKKFDFTNSPVKHYPGPGQYEVNLMKDKKKLGWLKGE